MDAVAVGPRGRHSHSSGHYVSAGFAPAPNLQPAALIPPASSSTPRPCPLLLFIFPGFFLLTPWLSWDLVLGTEPLWNLSLLHPCSKSRRQGRPAGSPCGTVFCWLPRRLQHRQPGHAAWQTCIAPSHRALPLEDKSKSQIKFTGMLAPITFPITLFFPSYYFFSPLLSPPPYFILGASESSTVAWGFKLIFSSEMIAESRMHNKSRYCSCY